MNKVWRGPGRQYLEIYGLIHINFRGVFREKFTIGGGA
jgi:hypothetical protein